MDRPKSSREHHNTRRKKLAQLLTAPTDPFRSPGTPGGCRAIPGAETEFDPVGFETPISHAGYSGRQNLPLCEDNDIVKHEYHYNSATTGLFPNLPYFGMVPQAEHH